MQLATFELRLVRAGDQRFDDTLQVRTHEDRDDRRGRLMGAESVVVACRSYSGPQQVLVLVHRRDECGQEDHEAQVVVGVRPRVQEVVPLVRAHGVVVVLAAAVQATVGLLVQ